MTASLKLKLIGLCWLGILFTPCVAAANPGVATVSFTGQTADPQVYITGEGFGTLPIPSNPASQGYTGYDYGESLYICDNSSNPTPFCAGENNGGGGGDTIGLVVNTYSGTELAYGLGSSYSGFYYPTGIFQLQQGDTVTVHISGLSCSGPLDY